MPYSEAKRLLQLPQRVFYGWWIVSISATADALKHGTFNRGFTFYVTPLSKELGVGVAIVSLAEMLGRLEGGLQGPLMGWLNDKFGPRFIMVLGGGTSGLGFILLGLTSNYIYFLLVFVGLLSLGFRAGYNNALMPAINQWFRRHRGLAMAVAGMGSPFGGILIAPMMGLLVYEIGWRNAAFLSGAGDIGGCTAFGVLRLPFPGREGAVARWSQAGNGTSCRHSCRKRRQAGVCPVRIPGVLPESRTSPPSEAMKTPSLLGACAMGRWDCATLSTPGCSSCSRQSSCGS